MGFKVQRTSIRLIFDEPALEGAEVVCRGVPVSVFLDLANLKEQDGAEAAQQLFAMFAEKALESWNLEEEDGTPIPATSEGVLSLETALVMRIIRAWMGSVTNPPAPLGKPSDNGAAMPPEPIPMFTGSL